MWSRWQLFSLFVVALIHLIEADVCKDTKPEFSAPGRRISEQKCREFNWERKRLEKCSTDAANIKYPYMGALGFRNVDDGSLSFLCAAFLISPKFAVTAAQCSKGPLPEKSPPEIVRFGNENVVDEVPRVDAKILRIITHPEFKPPIKYYDIALVELETKVPFSKSIYPACLWSKEGLDGVVDAGVPAWGSDKIRGKLRKIIAEMRVKVLDEKSCLARLETWYTRLFRELQDHQICGDESAATDLNCQGSAGAPLITTVNLDGKSEDGMPYASGLISFGRGCGDLSIYTKISSFIDWIEQNVWPTDTGSVVFIDE